MHATRTIRIPEVFHSGPLQGGGSFIVMEHLDMSGGMNQARAAAAGGAAARIRCAASLLR